MLRIPFGGDDTALLLAPSWNGWDQATQATALGIALLVPLALLLWLYRVELRLVSRTAAAGLLAFRLVVLVILWSLAALQPKIVHVERDDVPSRVIVAVDL